MGNKVNILIEGEKLDMYDNETIQVNRSIKDYNDVTKVYSEYSNSFTVPASPKNNKIFKHFYSSDLINGIDYTKRISSTILLNGSVYRLGGVEVNEVQMKNGKPSSYSITFFDKTSNIKEILGDTTLKDLDFSQYNHSYTFSIITSGVTTGLHNGNVVYPLYPTKQHINLSGNRLDYNNIWNNTSQSTSPNDRSGLRYTQLKPALKLRAIVDAINTHFTDLNITGDFFTTNDIEGNSNFNQLMMWLHHYEDILAATYEETNHYVKWSNANNVSTFYGNLNLNVPEPSFTYVSNGSNDVDKVEYTFEVQDVSDTLQFNLIINGQVVDTTEVTPSDNFQTMGFSYGNGLNDGDVVQLAVVPSGRSDYSFKLNDFTATKMLPPDPDTIFSVYNQNIQDYYFTVDMSKEVPPMKILDFLNGLIKLFNLVVTSEDGINYHFTKYTRYYNNAESIDLDRYLDYSNSSVNRVPRFKEISFLYGESEAIDDKYYYNINGLPYGSLSAELDNEESDELEVSVPFTLPNTVQIDNSTNIFYRSYEIDDNKIKTTTPKPILFYNGGSLNLTKQLILTDATLLTTQGFNITNISTVLNTSPVVEVDVSGTTNHFSLSYGNDAEPLYGNITYDGVTNHNLYSNWSNYIESIFNQQTRLVKVDAIIPTSILLRLKMNNYVFIKNRKYRINKMNLNLTNGKTRLELINVV